MGRAVRLLWLVERKEVVTRDDNGGTSTPSCNCQGTNYKPVQKMVSALAAGGRDGAGKHARSRHPTGVPERRESLLVLPAPGGLALIEHRLERRCFVVPGHVQAVGGKGRWSAFLLEPVESRANTNPSSVTACLGDVKRKGQFWKENRLSVVRVGHESILGLKYIIGIYML